MPPRCREEANLCFYLGKFEVADYEKEPRRFEGLDWLSFLEALGHIARFKELPLEADLWAAGFPSGNLPELQRSLELDHVTWNEWMAAHPPTDPDAPPDPFHVRLKMILSLLFYMLTKPPPGSSATSGSPGSPGSPGGGGRAATPRAGTARTSSPDKAANKTHKARTPSSSLKP